MLGSIKIGSDRICKLALSLRNFSRLDEAELKLVDLHEGFDSTLLILQHRIKAKPNFPQIQIIQDYGQLPTVECYPSQLNQVFMNLLSNAIDSLESRLAIDALEESSVSNNPQPTITIRTSVSNGDWVAISIADNGEGIHESIRSKLFDPFFTTKPVGKGTGLGLSISHQIVTQKHNGKIDCHSTLDQGTEFVVKIPVRQIES